MLGYETLILDIIFQKCVLLAARSDAPSTPTFRVALERVCFVTALSLIFTPVRCDRRLLMPPPAPLEVPLHVLKELSAQNLSI